MIFLFDNHPIDNNANEWTTYVRIFAKKSFLKNLVLTILLE